MSKYRESEIASWSCVSFEDKVMKGVFIYLSGGAGGYTRGLYTRFKKGFILLHTTPYIYSLILLTMVAIKS